MRSAFLRMLLIGAALILIVALRPTQPAVAVVHIAEIHEVMSGFDGDPSVQYVEINMRAAGQNFTGNSKLSAFDASGNFIDGDSGTIGDQPLLTMNGNVANAGDGVRWLMGTTAFETASGIQADFQFPASPGLPTGAGMVCLFESSRDFTNPNESVDCVAYGSYPGTTPNIPGGTNTPTALGPGNCQNSLTRTVATSFSAPNPPTGSWADTDSANDFVLAAPSPENNAGTVGNSLTATDSDSDTVADCAEVAVGGIAELPRLDGGQADVAGAPFEAAEPAGSNYGVVAGTLVAATAGAIVLGGAAWYLRRRRARR